MWQKILDLSITTHLAITGFVQDIKKDERGLSGIVVTVLLILVSVLAIVMVWGFLEGWLIELWDTITGTATEGIQPGGGVE